MSKLSTLATATALGVFAFVADTSPANATPPGGHQDNGCKSNCGGGQPQHPQHPPQQPPQQPGNVITNTNTANGWGYGEGGDANIGDINVPVTVNGPTVPVTVNTPVTVTTPLNVTTPVETNVTDGDVVVDNRSTTNYRPAANGATVIGGGGGLCPEGWTATAGTVGLVVGGGHTQQGQTCLANIAAETTLQAGAATGDQGMMATGVAAFAELHPQYDAGLNRVATNMNQPCSDRARSVVQLAVRNATFTCPEPVAVTATVTLPPTTTTTTPLAALPPVAEPLTCRAATSQFESAQARLEAASGPFTRAGRNANTDAGREYYSAWEAQGVANVRKNQACGQSVALDPK